MSHRRCGFPGCFDYLSLDSEVHAPNSHSYLHHGQAPTVPAHKPLNHTFQVSIHSLQGLGQDANAATAPDSALLPSRRQKAPRNPDRSINSAPCCAWPTPDLPGTPPHLTYSPACTSPRVKRTGSRRQPHGSPEFDCTLTETKQQRGFAKS